MEKRQEKISGQRLKNSIILPSSVIYYEAPEEEKNFKTLLDMIDASEVREDDETYITHQKQDQIKNLLA